jgi:hypothetical protein
LNAAYFTAGQQALLTESARALPELVEAESFALLESLFTVTTASTAGQAAADGGHAVLDFNLFLFIYFD